MVDRSGQTYQWAVSYPEMVPRILPFCGSAGTSRHNFVFLEGVKAALTADAAFQEGWYDQPHQGPACRGPRLCRLRLLASLLLGGAVHPADAHPGDRVLEA